MQKFLRISIVVFVLFGVVISVFAILNRPTPQQRVAGDMLKLIAAGNASDSYKLTSPKLKEVTTAGAWDAFVKKESSKFSNGYTFAREEAVTENSGNYIYVTKSRPYAYEATVGLEKDSTNTWSVTYVSTKIKPVDTKKE